MTKNLTTWTKWKNSLKDMNDQNRHKKIYVIRKAMYPLEIPFVI